MAKENKDKFTLTVGPKAYSFHDQATGITICRGEEVELSRRQFRSTKVAKALASGHLILVSDKSDIQKYSDEDIEKMSKRLLSQISKGMTIEKMVKAYSLEEMKLIALKHDIEADAEDTVETLITAIQEDVDNKK